MPKHILHPDIHIYLRNLKEFFLKNSHFYSELFGEHKMEHTLDLIKDYAILNWTGKGQPQLNTEQYLQVRARLDGIYSNPIFQTHSDYPPLCWN